MALAWLACRWARERGGTVRGLIIDHRLRPESAEEAAVARARLAGFGIAADVLPLHGLAPGPALAERAREARYRALFEGCRAWGIVHLLLGHHASDQAETLLMRVLGHSGPAGLAAMPRLLETPQVRLLRPLLGAPPGRLRATLRQAGIAWVEDPSNQDPRALRGRLRALRRDPDGAGEGTAALVLAAAAAGEQRATAERRRARRLAACANLFPEGYAVLAAVPLAPADLAAVLQAVSGAAYPPPTAALARLADRPAPATLAGVRLLRVRDRLLVVREAAAQQGPVVACPGAVWDRRFRLDHRARPPDGTTLAALGGDAARLRRRSHLPAAVLQTLPTLRIDGMLFAVPHLGYPDAATCAALPIAFSPGRPVASAPWFET